MLRFKKSAKTILIFLTAVAGCFYLFAKNNVVNGVEELLKKSEISALEYRQTELDEVKGQILQYVKGVKIKENEINELTLALKELEEDIAEIAVSIKKTEEDINKIASEIEGSKELIKREEAIIKYERTLIAQYLREMYELDDVSLLQVMLGKKKISDFLNNRESMEQIQKTINETIQTVKRRKFALERAKLDLEMRMEEQNDLKALQEVQKIAMIEKSNQKKYLLENASGEKIKIEKLLNEARNKFNSIKEAIKLVGGSEKLSFENALKYAEFIESKTGVRAAFLLAILKFESNWGQNTGSSLYLDALSGCVNSQKDQYGENYSSALSLAQRREKYFLEIVKELGLSETTLVSACPKSYRGTGGALGPAQFMPDTWLGYKNEVTILKGSIPSPFNIEDAMLAMGLKLAQAGANSRIETAEWKAAMIYFAGGNWDNSNFSFYGDRVIELTRSYQEEIDKVKTAVKTTARQN